MVDFIKAEIGQYAMRRASTVCLAEVATLSLQDVCDTGTWRIEKRLSQYGVHIDCPGTLHSKLLLRTDAFAKHV